MKIECGTCGGAVDASDLCGWCHAVETRYENERLAQADWDRETDNTAEFNASERAEDARREREARVDTLDDFLNFAANDCIEGP